MAAAKQSFPVSNLPEGIVPINSPYYIERPPIEALACGTIEQPGSLLRIRAPRKMGKSSLLLRIEDYAESLGYQVVRLDLRQVDEAILSNLNTFLRWLCKCLSYQLQLPPKLDEFWDSDIGSKLSCTFYLYSYLLTEVKTPVILIIKEIDKLFVYQRLSQDFFPLLRSWHEESKQNQILQQLRIVLTYSTEIYVSLKPSQSPFNTGLAIHLPEFNLEQVKSLAECYGFQWKSRNGTKCALELMKFVGGHPYLVHLTLYHLAHLVKINSTTEQQQLEQLLEEAPTITGIYGEYLREYIAKLKTNPELANKFMQVLAENTVSIDPILSYQLESLGLVKLEGNLVTSRCLLYRQFFSSQDWFRNSLTQLEILQQENQTLQQLSGMDDLTKLANRRRFQEQLQQEWERLIYEGQPLALILIDVDYFTQYKYAFGYQAGNVCLQQIADAIMTCANLPRDLVARYSGEEFAILLGQTDIVGGLKVAERVRQEVQKAKISTSNANILFPNLLITVSMGVASVKPSHEGDYQDLIEATAEALYKCKRRGGDDISLSETLNFTASD